MLEKLGIGEQIVFFLGLTLLSLRHLSTPITLAIVVAIFAHSFWRLAKSRTYWRERGIEGPSQLFFFGNTLQVRDGFANFDKRNIAKYGQTYGSKILDAQQLVTVDLDLIRCITVKEFASFTNRKIIGAPGILDNDNSVFAHGLLSLRDQRWKDVRTTVTPAFTLGKIKQMLPIFNSCLEITKKNLDKLAENGEEFDAKTIFGALTVDVIAKSNERLPFRLFGRDFLRTPLCHLFLTANVRRHGTSRRCNRF